MEMDSWACRTLTLRSFYRQFRHSGRRIPEGYYQCLRGEISNEELFGTHPAEAAAAMAEAQLIELGGKGNANSPARVDELIRSAVGGSGQWILLGGPPCQAYSLVGRARMGGIRPGDKRVNLYRHYLRILAVHQPAMFVFENVKGLASSKLKDRELIWEIIKSLENPVRNLPGAMLSRNAKFRASMGYRLYGLSRSAATVSSGLELDRFIIHAERHGIPQARHRLIIIGVREDLNVPDPSLLKINDPVPVEAVLKGMPRLRSGLSKIPDGGKDWVNAVNQLRGILPKNGALDRRLIEQIFFQLEKIGIPRGGRGGEFVPASNSSPERLSGWYFDKRLGGVSNHATRSHLADDLHRYFFAAVFAQLHGVSPKLQDFPKSLLPAHRNVNKAIQQGLFNDRFRVQVKGRPATTVTSHISKDGHYFIHPDPTQCRSLTVREAARIQTFPDNYFFCGPRTSQYTQVGNAVPPLLANKIASKIYEVLRELG